MRKNTQRVFNAWRSGRTDKRDRSIWTDGEHIFSYGTVIVASEKYSGVTFNATKYSPTTSNHQNSLRHLLIAEGFPIVRETDNEAFGTKLNSGV